MDELMIARPLCCRSSVLERLNPSQRSPPANVTGWRPHSCRWGCFCIAGACSGAAADSTVGRTMDVVDPTPDKSPLLCPKCRLADGEPHSATTVLHDPNLICLGPKCPDCGHAWEITVRPADIPSKRKTT